MTEQDINQSKAPLVEHLIELRNRLIKALIAMAVAFILCFVFADKVFNILVWPYQQAVGDAQDLRLIYTAPQEYFFTQLKLSLFGALFITFPVIAVQIYKFVAPGLYQNEKSAFAPFLIATPVLFAAGTALVYFIIMPLAMSFFLSLEQQGGDGQAKIELVARVSEYLGLIMTLIFAFGLCFQLPVLLTLLGHAGIASSEGLKSKRKYAVVGTFLAAAILTPPDPVSQIGLALPTLLLYEFSIWSVRMIEKKRAQAKEETDTGADAEADTDA